MNEDKLKDKLEDFLGQDGDENQECQEKDSQGQCIIKRDKSLVERINKKILTEDGRELLV